jgi:hypothetical protein
MSQAEAEAEVSRLNDVNAGKSCVYLYCTSRLVEKGDSDVPEDTASAANESNRDVMPSETTAYPSQLG